MRCLIRSDSSHVMGSGHIMRCLTLAEGLRNFYTSIEFVCRSFPGNLHTLIQEKGFIVHLLPVVNQNLQNKTDEYASWVGASQEQDASDTLEKLSDDYELLVVDHYGIDYLWENMLRQKCRKILVIDDLANRQHDCDFLLDHNFYINASTRYLGLVPNKCQMLVGPQYALINVHVLKARIWREQHYNMHQESPNSLKCLVFMGGMDIQNYTQPVVDKLISLEGSLEITVILGQQNTHINELQNRYLKYTNVKILIQPDNYYLLLAQTDFVVGAGGVSSLERFCIGVPAFVFQVADNQKEVCENLTLSKAAVFVGNIEHLESIENLKEIDRLSELALYKMGSSGTQLVDGLGLEIILKNVVKSE